MVDAIQQGRVLVDRNGLWRGLRESAPRWRRRAQKLERALPAPMDDDAGDSYAA
jgi:hypothetical protein